jgi:hypothetical protein
VAGLSSTPNTGAELPFEAGFLLILGGAGVLAAAARLSRPRRIDHLG